MKRIIFILCLVYILSGCSMQNTSLDRAMRARQELNNGVGCEFEAVVTADYGDSVYTFTLQCTADSEGNIEFSVIDPASISGISGQIANDKGSIVFDDKILAFSMMADGYITPVSAPWLFLKTFRGGYIHGCSSEESLTRLILHDTYREEPLQVDIWMDETAIPVRADFLWKDRRILAMDVKNFRYL